MLLNLGDSFFIDTGYTCHTTTSTATNSSGYLSVVLGVLENNPVMDTFDVCQGTYETRMGGRGASPATCHGPIMPRTAAPRRRGQTLLARMRMRPPERTSCSTRRGRGGKFSLQPIASDCAGPLFSQVVDGRRGFLFWTGPRVAPRPLVSATTRNGRFRK